MPERPEREPDDELRLRLERARARASQAVPGSPEWDAALAELEDVEQALRVLDRNSRQFP